jgi:alkanesulfonate monooxygenase SsuD/methylene tetrahydromethanopterin reductase-like flavin-dependent oxidoreductase (luciferase family)
MLIGHFTEQPWQDNTTGLMGTQSLDLSISNGVYDPKVGAKLYNRYLDEKVYAEEMGFDALMLNEHHSTPFCMQGVTNVGASILARETKTSKIIILGNILPIWDDPLWLAEQLAMIDMISYGRLVSGFVRGGGRESVAHNAPPHFNREPNHVCMAT